MPTDKLPEGYYKNRAQAEIAAGTELMRPMAKGPGVSKDQDTALRYTNTSATEAAKLPVRDAEDMARRRADKENAKYAKPGSYKRGGLVKRTGMAKVHRGERVLTKRQQKSRAAHK